MFISFAALVENYLRHAKGVNSTIFFYSFDVAGYIIYASNIGVLTVLTAIKYKEAYDYALPSLRKTLIVKVWVSQLNSLMCSGFNTPYFC